MSVTRRSFLGACSAAAASAVLGSCGSPDQQASRGSARPQVPARTKSTASAGAAVDVAAAMAGLEQRFGRRIGVVGLDPATGRRVGHRADERFLHCSTAKVLTVAAVVDVAGREPGLLARRLTYRAADLVPHSPVTGAAVGHGVTVQQACAAALTVSDNTAENLLLSVVGGPAAVTRYARTLGDRVTRLDRTEPALNERTASGLDTTTPAAMAADLDRLALGSGLSAGSRHRLVGWMRACTTGDRQIRAGVPSGWTVADKTGSGDHAESNDIAVLWPPDGDRPLVLAVYTDPRDSASTTGPDAIAATTRVVLAALT